MLTRPLRHHPPGPDVYREVPDLKLQNCWATGCHRNATAHKRQALEKRKRDFYPW